MARQVSLSEEVYSHLKQNKGNSSFSDFIKGLYTSKTNPNEIASIWKKIKKIEDYITQRSGGQYE